ncbi:hypothetical protein JXB41_02710 [Candidatus Woesearchaeota archaeon]|nr:hypothetical protein [Candidatus Woesearchaeota archaeon]
MKKTLVLIIGVLFLLSFNLVSALSFEVEYVPVVNQIYLDENAIFNIIITNTGNFEDVFQVYTPNIAWYVDIEPSVIRLKSGESKNITLELLPNAWATPGPQIVNLVIKATSSGDRQSNELSVYVKDWSIKGRTYAPSIELVLRLDEKIDPRKSIPVEIYLRNRNRLNIPELKIRVSSNLVYKEYIIPFSGLEERTEGLVFNIDPLTVPQDDIMTVSLLMENQSVNEVNKHYRIIEYSEFVEESDSKQELFKTIKDITITNKGNYEKYEIKRVEIGFLNSLFTKTVPKAKRYYENKKGYYEWELQLKPEEEFKIQLVTNFRPVIYLSILAVLAIIFYYISRSPIVSKKELIIIGSVNAGISEMKIILYLKNRTSDVVNNIMISDKIPSLAELIKESYLGTLEPTKILVHDKKGTIVKWELKSLEPFEERVITYRIKSKLNIVGGISLPPTKIKFDTKKGKERVIFSNKCELMISHN